MMIIDDLRDRMHFREISGISGISLSGYYYRPVKRRIQRPDPFPGERMEDIASERPTHWYRRVWAILKNQGKGVKLKIRKDHIWPNKFRKRPLDDRAFRERFERKKRLR